MFTLQDQEQLQKLRKENPHNDALIKKLLDSYQFALQKVSHEIRNPLTMISGTLQLIEKQHPEVAGYSHWNNVLEDIHFMERLLGELSSCHNGTQLHKRLIHTTAFLKRTTLSFASALSDSSIEFTAKIAQDLPPLWGDVTKLRQLFLNLLQNALEATSYKGKIYLNATCDSDYIIVKVADNGCGIPDSHLSDIFIPFTTYKDKGTGLGLSIVKSITEAHDGSVFVQSVPDKGTVFTISLPIKKHCN